MKPICIQCQRFYRPKKNGLYFVEGMPKGRKPVPVTGTEFHTISQEPVKAGKAEPHMWEPYKLWCGDIWECPDCLARIIVGVGQLPLAEHYQDDFKGRVRQYGATFQVNDC